MKYLYLSILVFSLSGIGWYDYKKRIFLFCRPKQALTILLSLVGFFLLWDITGIVLGVFFTNQEFVSGLYFFTPNMPIEEIFFLTLVCYVSIILSSLSEQKA